uniref:Rho guanine nucleotide exchange factor 26 n=1 Tax=Cacopsylla melanoneura TaxID=428564 RepID=A0A8D8XWS4_9HEMI
MSSRSSTIRRRPRIVDQVGIKSTSIVVLAPSITQQPLPPVPKRRVPKQISDPGLTELRCHNRCGICNESQEINVFLSSEETINPPTPAQENSSASYKNVSYHDNEPDSFSDSFDSDSEAESSELDNREPIHERSLPPPPTASSAQLNQNIYGFVKEAGRQMKKHWSLSSLGLNKIRKMSVGAIAQLPAHVGLTSEDGKRPSPIPRTVSSNQIPPVRPNRRWSSFKTKFRPQTMSTFYLDDPDPSARENTPPTTTPDKTEPSSQPPPLPEKDFRRKSIALGSLSSNGTDVRRRSLALRSPSPQGPDFRRQSIALRPSSPPPPPPVNRSISSDESSLNTSTKSEKNHSTSWYSDGGLFDPTVNVPTYVDKDQIKHLPPQGSAYWDNLWDSGNSSTPGASNSDSMSDPGSDLHLRFLDEPLYQFYNACIAELQFDETHENGYEEIGSSPMRTTMLEIIAPSHMNRSLWCQLPEVIDSGVLDTLDAGERKLQEAKFELITSEASYFKSLTILEKHFIASPLLADTNILNKRDRKYLFGNVTAVRKCSERLLAALEQCWQDSILLTNICEIVYQHVTNKAFNIYIKYCSNQFHIDRTLKSLRETNPKFIEALAELESNPVCQSLSLHSFLMLPMQRVTRLPLLFDAILTRLKPTHSEYETCHTALATLNKIVHECNEEARKMERYYEMLLLSGLIKFSTKEVKCLPVISSSRWLVRSGSLNFVNVDAKMTFSRKLNKTHFYAKLHLFLFTDLLVITKKKGNGEYSVIDYCTRAMMQMTALEDSMPPTNKYLILLAILENHEHKTVEIVLSCDSESGRQRWLEATAPPASSNPEETLYEQWDCPQVAVNHSYTAQQPDELNLQQGDVINVLRKMSDGWYHGERIRDGQKGWFPGNYTSEIASSHARAKNLKQRYRLLALSGSYLQSQEFSKKKIPC